MKSQEQIAKKKQELDEEFGYTTKTGVVSDSEDNKDDGLRSAETEPRPSENHNSEEFENNESIDNEEEASTIPTMTTSTQALIKMIQMW